MAEDQSKATQADAPAQAPVLRPGRAADPVPADARPSVSASALAGTVAITKPGQGSAAAVASDARAGAGESESESESDDKTNGRAERVTAESRQRKLRQMLRQCDRVLLMDFDLLAMNDWPDNYTLAGARRNRDLWLFSALLAAVVFLGGLAGLVSAWVAGGGFGVFVMILLHGVPAVRRIYTSKPSYLDLLVTRQRMLREAKRHAEHLEGASGLIWQCAQMSDFNPALRNSRFSYLLRLSESRVLPRQLTRREHVRLYLIYLLEAEKAYSRVQEAFFEGNQNAIDHGWQDVVAEPVPRT